MGPDEEDGGADGVEEGEGDEHVGPEGDDGQHRVRRHEVRQQRVERLRAPPPGRSESDRGYRARLARRPGPTPGGMLRNTYCAASERARAGACGRASARARLDRRGRSAAVPRRMLVFATVPSDGAVRRGAAVVHAMAPAPVATVVEAATVRNRVRAARRGRGGGRRAGGSDRAVFEQVVLDDVVEEDDAEVEPGVEEEGGDGVAVELPRGEADLGDVGDGPGVLVGAELRRRGCERGARRQVWAGSRASRNDASCGGEGRMRCESGV